MSLPHFEHDERPWGSYDRFTHNEPSTVKILRVLPEKRFSLQTHQKRSEWWRVIAGSGVVRIGDEERAVSLGDEVEIPIGTLHRLTGGPEGIEVLEIAFGEQDESDIVRIEDDYERA